MSPGRTVSSQLTFIDSLGCFKIHSGGNCPATTPFNRKESERRTVEGLRESGARPGGGSRDFNNGISISSHFG
ncbi:hypothetical protein GWI33_018629 [Rhynchophorus ferrugineus]|uniref:Uncharacterized protein n=1 Tax=Rhynchophorus ferrugineus TaxID=354439 RepID=A0A834M187_RHYFE|nr:hypothetical protein GWI33_018629 [Rhynchophorus ferrugineus]